MNYRKVQGIVAGWDVAAEAFFPDFIAGEGDRALKSAWHHAATSITLHANRPPGE